MKKCLLLCGLIFWSASAWGGPDYIGSGEWSDSEGGKGTFASTLILDDSDLDVGRVVYTLKFADGREEVFNIATRKGEDEQCQVVSPDESEVLGTCGEDGLSYTIGGNKIELFLGFKRDESLTDMIAIMKSIRVTISGKKTSSDGKLLLWQDTLKIDLEGLKTQD